MTAEGSTYARLGYGQMDFAVGDWVSSDDIISFTYLRHPEQDDKHCVRELLRVLGKRFPTQEAGLIWQEIENYSDHVTRLYGPPTGAVGRLNFEQAAHSWYAEYGLEFEKSWYLNASLERQYTQTGAESVQSRWLGYIHPDLVFFTEAGFSPWQILPMLCNSKWGNWWETWRQLRRSSEEGLAPFWTELAARLLNFELVEDSLEDVMREVREHALRLARRRSQPVRFAFAALDYFRRLELAGLTADFNSLLKASPKPTGV